ncbi:cytochrome P450 2J4-like [Protopterus annectens]|uniref:cytochrome P450 2J4-like n=1 Tax=Protopterus annectens TaxID=7888 RepID=UPI001CFA1ABA|nr:cytochrome P450 2J4-like [Protopterus annectens]
MEWQCLLLLWTVLVALAVFLVLNEVRRLVFPSHRLPPGPVPLPFLGNLLNVNFKDPGKTFSQLGEKYGDISTFYIGRSPAVILNGIHTIKNAFAHQPIEFAGRPSMPLLEWIIHGLGIVMAPYGISWKQQRKFALTSLRNFGVGKKSMEERISEEAVFLIHGIRDEAGKPFDPHYIINNAVSNIICSIVFGNRFEYDNARFQHLLHLIDTNMKLAGGVFAQVFNTFPFIKYLPGPHHKVKNNAEDVLSFIHEAVLDHKKTLSRDHVRDFIDAYLLEMEKQKSNSESTFHNENLAVSTADLFLAGTETTSSSLRWGLLYMAAYPEIQKRCQQEIDNDVGSEHLPVWEDRLKMHYVNATVHEILRFGNIAPLGVGRAIAKTCSFGGYVLPKGTAVIANLTSALFDPEHWKFPDQFNPENFLDEKGEFSRSDAFIPFSAGLRVCLGEQLARMELFLFFSSLLQHLDFIWPDPVHPPNFQDEVGLTRTPKPFKLCCQIRPTSFLQK